MSDAAGHLPFLAFIHLPPALQHLLFVLPARPEARPSLLLCYLHYPMESSVDEKLL